MNVKDFKTGFHIGMHGLGMINGIPHTNSKEAFEYWKEHGIQFFEADIAVTDDKQYVLLAHNTTAKDLCKLQVFEKPSDGVYSLKWLKSINTCKKTIKKGLSIISIEEFLNLIRNQEQIVIMIDTYARSIEEVTNIAKIICDYGEKYKKIKDRVMLELYSLKDIEIIRKSFASLKIIACIKEDGYDFWGQKTEYENLCGVDFVSCKWKYVYREKSLIDFCISHNIGVLSLSRFDVNQNMKKKMGININLVDIMGNGNPIIYISSILRFLLYKTVMLIHQ